MEQTLNQVRGNLERTFRRLSTVSLKFRNEELYSRCCSIGLLGNGGNRPQNVIQLDQDGKCEKYSVCWRWSAGPVLNSETIARWVYTPPHVEKPLPGTLCDSYFDDILNSGLSSQRYFRNWINSQHDVHAVGDKLAKQGPSVTAGGQLRASRKYLGAIRFSINELRTIVAEHNGETATLRIYDTAKENNRFHCEVFIQNHGTTNKKKSLLNQQMRVRLMTIAKDAGINRSPYLRIDDEDLLALGLTIHD